MAINVDLDKAYDRLEWDFIQATLLDIGLPVSLISLIMKCLATVSFQVNWHGELSEEFRPSRGLRQGDPLSPYLFVLCMERLSQAISYAVATDRWTPVRLSRHGPPLSHLFFADDLILFAEASIEQVHVLREVLDSFCVVSGQCVSQATSRCCFSKNVPSQSARALSRALRCPQTADLGRYLGVPLLHQRVGRHTYQHILDAVHHRLSGWASSTLSFAGRVTLVQSVLPTIPSYTMQTVRLPRGLCDALDHTLRQFLWGSRQDRRPIPLVSWDEVCLPKHLGGLGIRRIRDMNDTFLAKLGWTMINNPTALWVQVLASKYAFDAHHIPSSLPPVRGSMVWRSIRATWHVVLRGIQWRIGDGLTPSFWRDPWVTGIGPLLPHSTQAIPDSIISHRVSHFVDPTGQWNLEAIQGFLPPAISRAIAGTFSPSPIMGLDRMVWGASEHGFFTVTLAYSLLLGDPPADPSGLWGVLWQWNGPQRVRSFLWLLAKDRLLSNQQRVRRHLTADDTCLHCSHEESSLHVVRDCPLARRVWASFQTDIVSSPTFALPARDWLHANLLQHRRVQGRDWPLLFGLTCWFLWTWQNKALFAYDFVRPPSSSFVILSFADQVQQALGVRRLGGTGFRPRQEHQIDWRRPQDGWVKLNTDGASNGTQLTASAGGLLRDREGIWLGGFSQFIGWCSPQVAGALGNLHRSHHGMAAGLSTYRVGSGLEGCASAPFFYVVPFSVR